MSEEQRFEPEQLLGRLADAGIRFIVVGGLAANAHGSPSATYDLDIVPSWDRENLDALAAVLVDVAAIRHGLPTDAPTLPPLDRRTLLAGSVFTLDTRHGRFDLLAAPDPGLDYDALSQAAIDLDLYGVPVRVAALDDLMTMKRAAGRPKDRVELEILGALREQIDRRP